MLGAGFGGLAQQQRAGVPLAALLVPTKCRGDRPPTRAQFGTPSGGDSREINKRARVDTDAREAATSAEAARDPNPAEDDRSSESDDADNATVKAEVGILSKVGPTGKRRAGSAAEDDERVAPTELVLVRSRIPR